MATLLIESAILETDWNNLITLRPIPRKLGVLSQTTQSTARFVEFVKKITDSHLGKLSELRVVNTICDSTSKRQTATLALAKKVDCVLVVGGRNSANTHRLAEISTQTGVQTHHIETDKEIDTHWLEGCQRVGITAGASTPDLVIDNVVRRLEKIGKEKRAASVPPSRNEN